MWIITGPFDTEQSGDGIPEKTKLLKTDRLYGVGRHKDSALCINNKKVSRQNGEFIVGKHTEDDISNGGLVPTLSLRNTRSTAMRITRGENAITVNPNSTYELESGDIIRLANNVNAMVTWEPTVCFYTPSSDMPGLDLAACASMGLKLVTKHSRDVTHHVMPRITAPLPPSALLSLLNGAHFANPEWLLELIRRGTDVAGLETTHNPPLESEFYPVIDPVFVEKNPKMGNQVSWCPNENRRSLFDGIRFIFTVLGNGAGSATKAMVDIVTRGGGDRQLLDVQREAEAQAKGTTGSWSAVLRKRKTVLREGMRSGLVLVGDAEAMTAKGVPKEIRDAWEMMVQTARGVDMRIIHPSLISEAVFKADVSVLDCVIDAGADANMAEGSSNPKSLPDFIPSTHPEEPSQLPAPPSQPNGVEKGVESQPSQTSGAAPSRRLTRRATSRTPAPESAPPVVPMEVKEGENSTPIRKKPLKRRAMTGGLINELLGLDSTTISEEFQLQDQSQSALPLADPVPSTPARPARLKRRAGTAALNSQSYQESQSMPMETGEEPPLKKFKALFEESGHGGVTQTDGKYPASDGDGIVGTQLAAVREEEEEVSQSQTQMRKRKAGAMGGDADRDTGVETQHEDGSSTTKRRAIESVNEVQRSQKLKSHTEPTSRVATTVRGETNGNDQSAPSGKPDTDPSFLRAIASKKRGKKNEDSFDREFNQLRIAKPEVNNTNSNPTETGVQWAQEWDGLDDFEKDTGIRGNFMQIVEVKVWKDVEGDRPGRNTRRESGLGARMDWDGRDDFKKFRRKMRAGEREAVQLFVNEQQDEEPDEARWNIRSDKKGGHGFDDMTQSQDQSTGWSQPVFTQTPSAPKSRSKSQAKSKPKPRALYPEVDDDQEVEEVVGGINTQGKGTIRASAKGQASQARKKASQRLFVLDSEDEDLAQRSDGIAPAEEALNDVEDPPDLTLRSTGTGQTKKETEKTRGTKRGVLLEDSDSDQGMTFGGFVKKSKRKR